MFYDDVVKRGKMLDPENGSVKMLKVRRITAVLRSGEEVRIPFWELDSGNPGAHLLLMSAQHGNEIQGAETIRRFLEFARRKRVKGKVYAIPFANILALRDRRPHIKMKPEQAYADDRGHNMNRTWPGNPRGNDTARLSYAIYKAVGDDSTHCFDLHCWEKHVAPALLIRDVPELREIALKLAPRFVRVCPPNDKGASGYFCSTERIGLTYEFSGQYTIVEREVELGLRLITNFAKLIGLLSGKLKKGFDPVLFSDSTGSIDVTAPLSGLFVQRGLHTCEAVKEGELIGHIVSDKNPSYREIRVPRDGYLKAYGASRPHCDVSIIGHHPYVVKGERLAEIIYPL